MLPLARRTLLFLLPLALLTWHAAPLWRETVTWGGTRDWLYFFFLAEVDRTTILDYHQFPRWNPYYYGGAVHLANPQTYFLSPTFLFILAFGVPIGIRLTITCALLLAFDSMRRLGRTLGLDPVGATVAGAGYSVCGALAQHLGGGHVGWLGFAVLPYVIRSYLLAFGGDRRHVVWGALALAWIFGHFGVYPYPYACITLGVFGFFHARQEGAYRRAAVVIGAMVACSLALVAVRLLPLVAFISGHPREAGGLDGVNPLRFLQIYMQPREERDVPGHPWVWPEYANYFSVFGVALAILGGRLVLRRVRALRPVVWATVAFLIFQIGNVPPLPWWIFRQLPLFKNLRVPARFTVLVGLFACILIGAAATEWLAPLWERGRRLVGRERKWALLCAAACALYLVEVTRHNRKQWFQTFGTPPPALPVRSAEFHQRRGDKAKMHAYPRANLGTLDCFEESPLDISPRLRGDLASDEYLAGGAGTVGAVRWSPNRITLEVDLRAADTLVVNQNFAAEWRVTGGRLVNHDGLLAATIEPGRREVTFRYLPTTFLIGVPITLASFAAAIAYLILETLRRRR